MKKLIFYNYLAKPIIKLYVKICLKPKIIGIENIPKEGRVVLAGNHTNNLDAPLLIAVNKRQIHFLAKDSLMQGPKKIIFKHMGIIPVNRKIHDKNALNNAINVLNNDEVIGIFPEGTINKTKDIIMPFKIGAVKMASMTHSKIVPFTITGNYKLFNNNLCIEFLSPITIPKKEDLSEYNTCLMNIISKSLEEKRK